MTSIERTAYPRFSTRPSAGELGRSYTPTLRELDLARRATRGGEAGQLAFLAMLKDFQRPGYFPKTDDPEDWARRLKFNRLLADSVVLQNAADTTGALRSSAEEGYPLKREEVAQLSPYLTEHVKRFGNYLVDLEMVPAPLHSKMPTPVE